MNRIFYLAFFYLMLGGTTLFGAAFDEANRQYGSGNFSGAAAAYEKILTNDGSRAAVYYNLGNSYQSLKKNGLAILAYERARLLKPRDPDLLANLALARKAVASFEETGVYPRLEAAITYLSRDEWSWLLAGAALFLGVVIFVYGLVRIPRRIFYFTASFTGAAGLLILTSAAVLYLRRAESGRGIVLYENATVRLSPFEKAESLGTPGVGKWVRLGAKNGNFQYVEVIGTSLQGWLADKDVAAIVPE